MGAHIFICYAHNDRPAAERIHFALTGAGYTTFYDRESLSVGGEFHRQIQLEIERCDAFIFLISPDSVAHGNYAQSELRQARTRWPHPQNRVLPVLCREVTDDQVGGYLMAVTIVRPEGDLAADVLFAVSRLPISHPPKPIVSPIRFAPISEPRHSNDSEHALVIADREYWDQRNRAPETDLLRRIWQMPRIRIWSRPTEFRPARFRDLDDCADFVRSSAAFALNLPALTNTRATPDSDEGKTSAGASVAIDSG